MVAAVPLGLALGVGLGAVGGGGAILALPLLVYVLKEDVHTATTTSLVVVSVAAIVAGAIQAGRARVCWPQVRLFAPAAVGGAIAASYANRAVSGTALLLAFAPVLLAASAAMWARAGTDAGTSDGTCPSVDRQRTLLAGGLVGGLTGFFGVGGGFLVVPMLLLALHFPVRRAIGTSLVIVAAASLAALATHMTQAQDLDAELTLGLTAGCAAGALIGAKVGERLPQRILGQAFAAIAAAAGLYLLVATAVNGAPA